VIARHARASGGASMLSSLAQALDTTKPHSGD
jgi:hypothetical protein